MPGLLLDRTSVTTSWPAPRRVRSSADPIKPDAPETSILMEASERVFQETINDLRLGRNSASVGNAVRQKLAGLFLAVLERVFVVLVALSHLVQFRFAHSGMAIDAHLVFFFGHFNCAGGQRAE